MLKQFKKEEESDYTWTNVCQALQSIGNNRLAKSIQDKYGEGKSQYINSNNTCRSHFILAYSLRPHGSNTVTCHLTLYSGIL